MPYSVLIASVAMLTVLFFLAGKQRSIALVKNSNSYRALHSLPIHYGLLAMIWAVMPALVLLFFWFLFKDSIVVNLVVKRLPEYFRESNVEEIDLVLNQIYNIAYGDQLGEFIPPYLMDAADYLTRIEQRSRWLLTCVVWVVMVFGGGLTLLRIRLKTAARPHVEKVFHVLFLSAALLALFITGGIIFSVLLESLRFFQHVPAFDFMFGTTWDPQVAMRSDQYTGGAHFGAIPLFLGSILIAFIALVVAVPAGLMSAVYLSDYASTWVRDWVKPLLEILAGIPTVVYGFFAVTVVGPGLQRVAQWVLEGSSLISPQSALAAGLVLGLMIIPYISSISDDVLTAVPQSMRDAAFALGATKSEMVTQILVPAALPGIMSGVLLAASRAIGETMIVVMAAGLAANLSLNPLNALTTTTVQIKTLLEGDQAFDSPETLAAFALGLMLFCVTLTLNFIALRIVRKFREQYD